MAAFVDCNSGEVVAMAHYDPGEKNPDKPFKLRPVTDQFEPGSSFKIFSAAALLETGEIDFAETTFCENGRWKIGRRTLSDSEEHGWLNLRSIFELSSNIGLAKQAIRFGGRQIFETAEMFGFGRKTDVGLPGESSGSIAEAVNWSSESVTASLAIGYGVAVTALQFATATAAVANGGTLYKPYIVVGQVDDDGKVNRLAHPEVLGQPIMPSTVDTLKSFMRGVVEFGTATRVNSEMIDIAGKTGTAWMANLEKGGYFRNKHFASFAGFFPYENPVIAGVVVLENPRPVYYGGWTAGPTFKRIAERWTRLNPDRITGAGKFVLNLSEQNVQTAAIPNLIGRDVILAETIAASNGFNFRRDCKKGVVVWQYPPADRLALYGDDILVSVQHSDQDELILPDLRGLSIRQAAAVLSFLGIKYEVDGNGQVVRQWPLPGKTVSRNAVCNIHCG
jgi:cell division protein FtsI (penicillin-binding protein 3)